MCYPLPVTALVRVGRIEEQVSGSLFVPESTFIPLLTIILSRAPQSLYHLDLGGLTVSAEGQASF